MIQAQLVETDLEMMEGTLVTFRSIMLLGGARDFSRDTACSSGPPQEKRGFPFHKLLQACGEKFGLLNTFMSVIEIE